MANVSENLPDWSNTGSSNQPDSVDSATVQADIQAVQAGVRGWLAHKGADIASVAGTTDIGAVEGLFHDITGANAITGFGTVSAGIWKILKFEGAATLTHNATSLIIPGGVNITCASGDMLMATSEGSGNWRVNWYIKASGVAKVAGTESIWVPAGSMIPQTTNGAAPGLAETTTNDVMVNTLDFDKDTDEFAQFMVRMPKSWDEGTVTGTFVWTHGSTTTNFDVIWGLQGIALSNDDALDTAFGTAQTVTDTGGTTDDVYQTSATSAITIGGTPSEGDLVVFRVYRDANAGGDTLAVDAKLIGVLVNYTTNAANDA